MILPSLLLSLLPLAAASPFTPIHEPGRCALSSHCGSSSFFGKEAPCVNNSLSHAPSSSARAQLVSVCGDAWSEGNICCDEDQVTALADNLKTAQNLIAKCPACEKNFVNLFCTFTCSADQSTFVNVMKGSEIKDGRTRVDELDTYVDPGYVSEFFDSCKDVKFGQTGTPAMSFLGGGAKTPADFVAFLGKKQALGSPFQMNFPRVDDDQLTGGLEYNHPKAVRCDDESGQYRCVCADCPAVCPTLPALQDERPCHVGYLPCLSFASILVYSTIVMLAVLAIAGHVLAFRNARRRDERLRLLQDTAPSDDEDDEYVHGAGIIDRPQRRYRFNDRCDAAFASLGRFTARYPLMTILTSVLVVAIMCAGWSRFELETDPVRLWVSPDSPAAKEKTYFDEHFGPFYRSEQVFLTNRSGESVLSYDTLKWWSGVESQVAGLKSAEYNLALDDVCFKPTDSGCALQSVTQYFTNTGLSPSTWRSTLKGCAENPSDCLAPSGQPIDRKLILGGYNSTDDVADAHAMVVTWVVNNYAQGSKGEALAMDWESSLKTYLLAVQDEASERGLRLSFNTEISLEEELNASTNTDAKIVVISYIVMFIYASLALGSASLSLKSFWESPLSTVVRSKFTLGVAGIIIVLMSVAASVGLFSAVGVKSTLIIAEVIPFLVLAVGVDNIFLIVHEFDRVCGVHPGEPVSDRMGLALGRMGPSILLSALTETVAFALGAFVGMPAVKNFAAYAAGAVFINALLQVTMFTSVLALNQRRVEDSRVDCFPFIKISSLETTNANGAKGLSNEEESMLQSFIRKYYAPTLLNKKVKAGVVIFFLGVLAAAVALIPEVKLGLDQRIAIPDGSYLIDYFDDLSTYFETGPPAYFIAKDLNLTEIPNQKKVCAAFPSCNELSLANRLELEGRRPDVSYISGSPASWIDDYLWYLNPSAESCCVQGFDSVCLAGRDPAWNITLSGMPEGEEFTHFLPKWLSQVPDMECPIAGKAAYSQAVVPDYKHTTIATSHFRTMHTALQTQDDFINAYKSARRIADEISSSQAIDVFPYSKFYIFFDQYITIVDLTAGLLGSAIALILIITSVLLGSIVTGLIITLTVTMIVIDILGVMALANVSLNAVSLVNLVICVGIAVEFCAHIARSFMFPSGSVLESAKTKFRGRDARVWAAMVNVGGSVFSGITITKLLGVFVLAFTRSKIFEIYYFRIWMALVVLASTHALVFLPVALSLVGGDGYLDATSDGGFGDDLAARRYRALLPEDEYDSDGY